MNYDKYKFTKEQFLYDVLSVEDLAQAPLNLPFLYTKQQKNQKDVILRLMKELSVDELDEMLKDEKHPITVQFWVKVRGQRTQVDHFQDHGGTIVS